MTSIKPKSYNVVDEVDDSINGFSNVAETAPSFENEVKQYVNKNKSSVIILTPCYGGLCHVNYTLCLIETIKIFNYFSIPLQVDFCKNDSLVSRARNNLVAKAMNRREMTHMMFIDNDISWNPNDVIKLILDDKNLIGGVYPLKKYKWSKCLEIDKEFLDLKNTPYLKDVVSDDDTIRSKL